MNGFIRFTWALTEEATVIKLYKQWEWSQLPDAHADPQDALDLLSALHRRWATLLTSMSESDFQRTYQQPETGRVYSLGEALVVYAWHGEHHSAQIRWLSDYYAWPVGNAEPG